MGIANKNIVIGLSGESLTPREKEFIEKYQPVGFILFARNCSSASQVKKFTKELRRLGHDPLIMIDQEGGRINRLQAFNKQAKWPAAAFGKLAEHNLPLACYATYLNYLLIATKLYELGINVNCAPVLDLQHPEAHDIIGDRSFSHIPSIVSRLGKAVVHAMYACNVTGVIKHIPGHGRAIVDSHEALPVIDTDLATLSRTDFAPFIDLADLPLAMTAHIIYTQLDPDNPVTTSQKAIKYIREGMGYNGVLISDDISMKALSGNIKERAIAAFDAGCDLVLHCNGNIDEMEELASVARDVNPSLAERLVRAYHFDDVLLWGSERRANIANELTGIMEKNGW